MDYNLVLIKTKMCNIHQPSKRDLMVVWGPIVENMYVLSKPTALNLLLHPSGFVLP